MEWCFRAMHGEERLSRVFWIYGFVLLSIFAGIRLFCWPLFSSFMETFTVYGTWVLIILGEGLAGLWLLMLWVCAEQSNRRIWFYLTRLFVAAGIMALLYVILLAAHFPPALWLWHYARLGG